MTSTEQSITIDHADDDSVSWYSAVQRLNLKKRVCSTFISKEVDKKYCVCNNPQHTSHTPVSKKVWKWKEDTTKKPTIAAKDYGVLPHTTKPFLRCDIDTKPDQVCLVLLGVWCMPVPNLIMRMISDASSVMSVKLEKELLQGISNAAVASDAWIITSGYKEEAISELIGEIVYKNQLKNGQPDFCAIAVGKWGNIDDCRKLEQSDNPFVKNDQSCRYTLESNHTHYVFFDDGTFNSTDNGGFVSKLARHISSGAQRKIPFVNVLVGGNLYALKSIWNDIKHQGAVVIVDQSGPLANILCKYLKATKNIEKTTSGENLWSVDLDEEGERNGVDIDILMLNHAAQVDSRKSNRSAHNISLENALRPLSKFRRDIYNDLLKLYNVIRQEEHKARGKKLPVAELLDWEEKRVLAKYIIWFASCLTRPHRDSIHVFDFSPSDSLQSTIYRASVQARNNLSINNNNNTRSLTVDAQTRLALRWSIPNITEDALLTSTMDGTDPNKNDQNRLLILDALSKNLHVVVRNFLQLDIDLSVLFACQDTGRGGEEKWSPGNEYLQELYSTKRLQNSDPLYLLDKIMTDQKLDFENEKTLNTVLEIFVGDFMNPLYEQKSQENEERKQKSTQVSPMREKESKKRDVEYIYRDTFLWCVLTYRLATAKIILCQMETRICSALIASKILNSLAAYAPDHDSKERLNSEASIFETYAIEFLRCSYSYDKHRACELIIRSVKLYGDVTCLQMSILADAKKFLFQDACQNLLTNIWYDRSDPVQERSRLAINLLTMGISQFFFSIYDKCSSKSPAVEQSISPAPPKLPLAKHGIDYSDDYGVDVSPIHHFLHFHNLPIVKYIYTCVGYLLFLLFFSYYMLYAFNPLSDLSPNIHWTEILTIIIVTTMLFEELRLLYFQDDRLLKGKILTYFDLKNRVSNLFLMVPSYLLFYIGLILRFVLTDADSFSAARIVMAYDLELWFIRAVLFLSIDSNLGPKLVMIRKMTNDLLLFVLIIVVFIFGYGITSRSMIAYNTFDFDGRQFFHNVVYPVYYFVLGSFDSERDLLDNKPDAGTSIATQVMFAFHMLFVNILLLNLLIALFSNTINDVQENASYIWAYDRCILIHDYYFRPALFPPFTFLISTYQFCRWCWKKCRSDGQDAQCFKMVSEIPNLDNTWQEFERFSTNDYVRQLLDAQANLATNTLTTDITSESSSGSTNDSKWLKAGMDQLKDELTHSWNDTREQLSEMEQNFFSVQNQVEETNNRVDTMTTQIKSFQDSLNWIMKAMERVKMDRDPPILKSGTQETTTNQGRVEPTETAQSDRRRSTVDKSLPPKQRDEETLTTNGTYISTPQSLDDHNNA